MTILPDLAAMRLDLRALDTFPVTDHMGRAVNQARLTLVGVSNPALANALHDPGDAKPLTASGLMLGRAEAGSTAWVRFTALSADTTAYHDAMKKGETAGNRDRPQTRAGDRRGVGCWTAAGIVQLPAVDRPEHDCRAG